MELPPHSQSTWESARRWQVPVLCHCHLRHGHLAELPSSTRCLARGGSAIMSDSTEMPGKRVKQDKET